MNKNLFSLATIFIYFLLAPHPILQAMDSSKCSEFDRDYNDFCSLCDEFSKLLTHEEPTLAEEHFEFAQLILPSILQSLPNNLTSGNTQKQNELAEQIIESSQWSLQAHNLRRALEYTSSLTPKTKQLLMNIINTLERNEPITSSVEKAVKIALLEHLDTKFCRKSAPEKQAVSIYGLNCRLCEALEVPLGLQEKIVVASFGEDSVYKLSEAFIKTFVGLILLNFCNSECQLLAPTFFVVSFLLCVQNIIKHSQKRVF